ncbi:hypothetical protein CEE45_16090 [Candidatus Heimdallarchaeota archaeon B3_Heim]|nr:MAG: hypothetical protein CEE45_16090 [Candidatus Heimdallarchaeota archaeon B3_Heim]
MKKPKVEVFSPVGVCGCSFATWIDNVWDILMKYKDYLEIESLTSDSSRAHKLGVGGQTVVINGESIPVFLLEQTLLKLLGKTLPIGDVL